MSKRALFAIALMLFSMFFGAGNLIFPPMLGANAGDNFVPAVTGAWQKSMSSRNPLSAEA